VINETLNHMSDCKFYVQFYIRMYVNIFYVANSMYMCNFSSDIILEFTAKLPRPKGWMVLLLVGPHLDYGCKQ
jgi:hypothetical protein